MNANGDFSRHGISFSIDMNDLGNILAGGAQAKQLQYSRPD